MNAGLLPLFPECGTGDAGAATSAACGQAMQSVCAQGYGDASQNGDMHSLLLNPQSNCASWMNAIQTTNAVTGQPAPGTPFLDAAMHAYCWGQGMQTDECRCLSFPARAAAWCETGSATCPAQFAASSLSCCALEFAQTSADGELQVIQFSACNPYACWLGDCYEPPQTMLLDSTTLLTQYGAGNCAEVCGQVLGQSTDNIEPMPPGSFAPKGGWSANQSRIGACGSQTQPALVVGEDTTWVWPANGYMLAPVFLSNDGDYPAALQLTSASTDMCWLASGDSTIVPARGSQQVTIQCDAASVSAWFAASTTSQPPEYASITFASRFEWSYSPTIGGEPSVTTSPIGIDVVVTQAHGPIVVDRAVVPWWAWLVCAACIVLAIVQIVAIAKTKASIRALDVSSVAATLYAVPQGPVLPALPVLPVAPIVK